MVDVLKDLLSAGVDVAATDLLDRNALHLAYDAQEEECVRVLLEAAEKQGRLADVLSAVDQDRRTPLDMWPPYRCMPMIQRSAQVAVQEAAKCGQVDALRKLLRAGADVAGTDSDGRSALHWASLRGREECVRVLLEAAQGKYLLNEVDENGDTPLDVCYDRSCVSLLLQRGGRGRDALHKAAKWNLTDVLKKLLTAGADVAAPDCTGRNALHWAAAEGCVECARLLLEAAETQGRLDAVLSAVDQGGRTPLHVSWHEGCSSLIRQRQGMQSGENDA